VAVTLAMAGWLAWLQPLQALASGGTLAVGLVMWAFGRGR